MAPKIKFTPESLSWMRAFLRDGQNNYAALAREWGVSREASRRKVRRHFVSLMKRDEWHHDLNRDPELGVVLDLRNKYHVDYLISSRKDKLLELLAYEGRRLAVGKRNAERYGYRNRA